MSGNGRTLARATLATRTVDRACAQAVTVSVPHTPKPIARRVTLACATRRPLEVEAHPILPAGSQLIVAERGSDTWLASAVLLRGRSRLYVFSAACRVT